MTWFATSSAMKAIDTAETVSCTFRLAAAAKAIAAHAATAAAKSTTSIAPSALRSGMSARQPVAAPRRSQAYKRPASAAWYRKASVMTAPAQKNGSAAVQ